MADWRKQSVNISTRIGAMPVPDRSVLSTLANIDEKLRAAETMIADVEFNLICKIDAHLQDPCNHLSPPETPCNPPHRHTPAMMPPSHEKACKGILARFMRGIKAKWGV
jgi:hypothetical protein